MRFLQRRADRAFELTDKILDRHLPQYPYAILSHRWGRTCDEVTYEDVTSGGGRDKAGFEKLIFCADQAARDGLRYFWIDSCCIKKSSDAELSESINSMYRWYARSARCYVYLSDVVVGSDHDALNQPTWEPSFRHSPWFTRGWTLQELLAPTSVQFFTQDCKLLGDKQGLSKLISDITGIAIGALEGVPMSKFGIDERFQWAESRHTTRPEDWAYCLFGVFDISMSIIYGEGQNRAVERLRREIDERGARKRKYETAVNSPVEPLGSRGKKTGSDIRDETLRSQPTRMELIEALRFGQIDDRLHNVRPRHAQTCDWFLDTKVYLDWITHDFSDNRNVLWVKGKAGSGKSTLMDFVFMHLDKHVQDMTVLSFFFNARGTNLEKNITGLYRSLLFQLLQTCIDDRQALELVPHPNADTTKRLQTDRYFLQRLLVKVTSLLRYGDQRKLIFVVDALDECDEDEVREMVECFGNLITEASSGGWSLRLLFASRPYPHITMQGTLRGVRGKKAAEIKEQIIKKASGIFMWVVLVVKILNKLADHGQERLFQERLSAFPNDLHELFRGNLTRDSENLRQTELCLQILLFARKKLTLKELYFAIWAGLDAQSSLEYDPENDSVESMDRFVLSSSKGLAEVTDSKDRKVQFIHEYVRDYLLLKNGLSHISQNLGADPTATGHEQLKLCCWNQIRGTTTGHFDVNQPLPRAETDEEDALRLATMNRFPFLPYAVSYMFEHAEVSHAHGLDQAQFVSQSDFSPWIFFNNLFDFEGTGRLPSTISLTYLFVDRQLHNLLRLVNEPQAVASTQYGIWKNPIFAAIAQDDIRALKILMPRTSASMFLDTVFPYPYENIAHFLMNFGTPPGVELFLSTCQIDMDFDEFTAHNLLAWACEKGSESLALLLLQKVEGLDTRGRSYDPSALLWAVRNGLERVVSALLEMKSGGPYGVNNIAQDPALALNADLPPSEEEVRSQREGEAADIDLKTVGSALLQAYNIAIGRGHERIVKLCLDKLTSLGLDTQSARGHALWEAAEADHDRIANATSRPWRRRQ